MLKKKWWLLQLFADGGDGGSAGGEGAGVAATGVTDAAAEHQRLRELGVPEARIRKDRSYNLPKAEQRAVEATQPEEAVVEGQQVDSAEQPTEAKRMTWDEIKADPEYNKELQSMMQQRLRKSKADLDNFAKLTPALEVFMQRYGIDPENPDYEMLSEKMLADDSIYADRAMELGVDPEIARKLDQFDLMKAKEEKAKKDNHNDEVMRQHYASLVKQGEDLKAVYPNFDLQLELQNPAFARMTAPGTGIMSVRDAYEAVHRQEIAAAAVNVANQQALQNITNAVRSGTIRPEENGASSTAASVSTFDYRNASKEQRAALKKRIQEAAARGEKIYPGQ